MTDFFSKLLTRLLLLFSLAAPVEAPEPAWTTVPPQVNYITKMQFRARTRETIVTDSPTLPGWTLLNEEIGEWGEWTTNGAEFIEATADREVQAVYHAYANPAFTEYIYRERTRSCTYIRWSAWSAWQDGFILGSGDREVQSRTLYAVDEDKLPSSLHIEGLSAVPMFPGTGCQLQYLPGVATLRWRSTNPAAVSVSDSGYLSAHQPGASRIIASTQGGAHIASFTVIVGLWEDSRLPEALQIIPAETFSGSELSAINLRDSSITRIGDRAFADCDQLRIILAGSRPVDIAWNAFDGCDRLVIACTQDGPISRYAQDWGVPYYIIGEPEPWHMITSVDLPVGSTAMRAGEGVYLQASVLPSNASLPDLIWTSSNPSAASVTADGYVCAVSPGYTIITARAQDGSAQYDNCMVTVYPADYSGSPAGTGVVTP